MTPGERVILLVHAAIILAVISAVTILAAMRLIDRGLIDGVYFTALGLAGAKATQPTGRNRGDDGDA